MKATPQMHLERALFRACSQLGVNQISIKQLRDGPRGRPYPDIRKFVSAYLRALDACAYSYPRIARMVGVGHHTSIMIAERRAHEFWGSDLFRVMAKTDFPRPDHTYLKWVSVTADDIEAIGSAHLIAWRDAA